MVALEGQRAHGTIFARQSSVRLGEFAEGRPVKVKAVRLPVGWRLGKSYILPNWCPFSLPDEEIESLGGLAVPVNAVPSWRDG